MINSETECPEDFPAYLWPGFKKYVLNGIEPGSFMRAFFEGDFHEMCRRGGRGGIEDTWPMVIYLHNHCPSGCYGSRESVQEWMANGGLEGVNDGN